MDDSQPGIDDLVNDAYFPRYGAAVCYTGSSTRRTKRKHQFIDEPLPLAGKPPLSRQTSKSLSENDLLALSKPLEDQYHHLSEAQLLHIQKIPTALVKKRNQVCSHEKHKADWAYVKLETFSQEEMKAVKTKSYVSIYPLCDGRDCVILRQEPPSRVGVYRYK